MLRTSRSVNIRLAMGDRNEENCNSGEKESDRKL